jgi:hypothetical protein
VSPRQNLRGLIEERTEYVEARYPDGSSTVFVPMRQHQTYARFEFNSAGVLTEAPSLYYGTIE